MTCLVARSPEVGFGYLLIETWDAGDGEGPTVSTIEWSPTRLGAVVALRNLIEDAGEGRRYDSVAAARNLRKVGEICDWFCEDRATSMGLYQIEMKDGQPVLVPVKEE